MQSAVAEKRNENGVEQYRQQCAVVAKQLNDTKTAYLSEKITKCDGNPKLLHKLIDKLLVNQHQQQFPSHDNDELLANKFAEFFEDKIDKIRSNFTINNIDEIPPPLDTLCLDHFRPASYDEVYRLITSYGNKSCELDSIPTWLLKECVNELLPLILPIINNSLSTGVFPSICKQTVIRLLLKKPNVDPEVLKNYRPVSNLNFISKILEKTVMQRIEEHIEHFSLQDPLQSAYRQNHSTETAITKLCNDVITSLDRGQCTVLASLDLSAAFDTVDHDILLQRLYTLYGMNGTVQEWFRSYLTNRQTKVCIASSYSKPRLLKCGVPQGSVLGARLYTMYTRPMADIMSRHNVCYHSYADDSQIYIVCNNDELSIKQAVKQLEDCITDVCEWMRNSSLKINQDKTDFTIFSTNPEPFQHITLTVGTDVIPQSKSIKILGVTLDCKMNMQGDIANTCRSTYMSIRKINSIRRYLCENSTKMLVNSIVLSRLDYCNSAYVGLPQKSLHRLQLAQNSAARIINLTPRHHHITPVLQRLNWLTVSKRCQLKILMLTFKVLHRQAPPYICELFHWYTPARPLRSASTTSLVPKRNKTVRYGRRMIDTSSASLWNSLPNNIKCARNVLHFKRLAKLHLASS